MLFEIAQGRYDSIWAYRFGKNSIPCSCKIRRSIFYFERRRLNHIANIVNSVILFIPPLFLEVLKNSIMKNFFFGQKMTLIITIFWNILCLPIYFLIIVLLLYLLIFKIHKISFCQKSFYQFY